MKKLDRLNDAIKHLRTIGIISTQQDIADNMRMHKSTISSALSGNEKYLTDSFLSKFNFAFNCIFDEEWLINGIGSMLHSTDYQENTTPDSTSLNQRIKDIVDYNKKTVRAYAIEIGVSQPTLKACVDGSNNPSFDTIQKILIGNPLISAEWLLRGEGEMIKSDTNTQPPLQSHDASSFYERDIEKKDRKIEELTLRVGWLQHEVEMLKQDKKTALRKDDVLSAVRKTGTSGQ